MTPLLAATNLTIPLTILGSVQAVLLAALLAVIKIAIPMAGFFFAARYMVQNFKDFVEGEEGRRNRRLQELRQWKRKRQREEELDGLEEEYAAFLKGEADEDERAELTDESYTFADTEQVKHFARTQTNMTEEEIAEAIREGDLHTGDLTEEAFDRYQDYLEAKRDNDEEDDS